MKNHTYSWMYFIVVFVMSSHLLIGQGCIETPEIEGTACGSCTPEGWNATSSTPDIVDPSGTLCGIGESPGGGGNVMHLFSNGSNDIEGVVAEVMIDDFMPGTEYYFSMYFAQCGNASSDIEITIDGEEYSFGPSDDWEIFEICLTPSSSNFEVLITVAPYSGGLISNTLVDDGECDPLYCCQLLSEIEEGPIEICPDEMYTIQSDYTNEEGGVEVIWTSDPSSGINFLDNPDDINPTFYMPPQTDFFGEDYTFYLSVEDDNCIVFEEVELTVSPAVVPEFEIYLCEIYEDQELPLSSFDPYTGTWEGNFNFDELGGTIQEYTFTLDSGQDNCIEEWTYEYEIEVEVILTFDIGTVYCVDDDITIRLPDESEEEVEGDWSPRARFNPSDLGIGTFTYTFQPDMEYFCSEPYDLEITITAGQQPVFDFPLEYCSSNDTLFLPTISADSISGSWTPPFITLDNLGSVMATFSANSNTTCYEDVTIDISVLSTIENTFNIPDTICNINNQIIVLDSTSLQGNKGVWFPNAFDLDTINVNQIVSTWTPDSVGCSNPIIHTITILEPQTPQFDLPQSLCKSFGEFTFPTISLNGISGQFSPPTINTLDISGSSLSVIFTPENTSCASPITEVIDIVEDAIPSFNIPNTFCPGNEVFVLPNMSDNGIEGNWSVTTIDPSTIGDSIISIFSPLPNYECTSTFDITFYVTNNINPEFNLPVFICQSDTVLQFPNISTNNINGEWLVDALDPSNYNDVSFTNTFTPFDIDCYAPIEITIEVLTFENVTIEATSPSTCEGLDGQLSILNTKTNMEFSIDQGSTWQSNPLFDNLSSGNYTVLVRYSYPIPMCSLELNGTLVSPESATIDSIAIYNISNCTDEFGSVTCYASGNNIEYSINDGTSWQMEAIFNDLQAGPYTLIVRSDFSNLCTDTITFEIEKPTAVVIDDIIIQDPSDCIVSDGRIEILTTTNAVEYSIDNGLTWQQNNMFNGLSEGDYNIIVMSTLSSDCQADTLVTLFKPDAPIIEDVEVVNINNCGLQNGQITIISSSLNVEYSIDRGINWFTDSMFTNLSEGDYQIVIRNKDKLTCIDTSSAVITSPQPIDITDLDIKQPTDCISNDGMITILSPYILNYEFSIDAGNNWSDINIFMMLEPSIYTLLIRDKQYNECTESIEFEIIKPPCPCEAPNVTFNMSPTFCEDPNSGSIAINNISGFFTNEDYIFKWENGSEDFNQDNLSEGWYSFNISYDFNCFYEDSIYVEALDPLTFGLLTFDQNCKDLGIIEVVDFEGGSGNYEFSIDNFNYQPNTIFSNLTAQEYSVWIQDMLDCQSIENGIINANFQLALDLPQIDPIQIGEVIQLNPLINETSIDSFVWFPQEGLLDNALVASASPSVSTEYTLTIYFGECIETRTVMVEVLPNLNIYVANTFSPNNDNDNDVFIIQGPPNSEIVIDHFNIYDRWGNLVFTRNNFRLDEDDIGWDGYYNNSKANLGVYVYHIQYEVQGRQEQLVGTIDLLR